jgi:CRISPR-associated protein Csx10
VPKTAQSCKRHPGFLYPEGMDNDSHGVRDTLIDWALFKLSGESPDALKIMEKWKDCSYKKCEQCADKKDQHCKDEKNKRCGEAMDHFDGYYRRFLSSNARASQPKEFYQYVSTRAQTRLQTHTGMNRETGTVQNGILYNRESFIENTKFWGHITFPDDDGLIDAFEDFLEVVNQSNLLHIGTGRTRGMGKVGITFDRPEVRDEDRYKAFKARVNKFNTLVHTSASEIGIALDKEHFFFALTLHSPMILTDALLRYKGTIDPNTLSPLIHVPTTNLKLEYYTAQIQRVTGWVELWGLPRAQVYAMDTGSVFLFRSTSALSEDTLQALFQLEEGGMGKRTAEGFGQLCVSDPFHQEVERR